jgi:hypothetical protein
MFGAFHRARRVQLLLGFMIGIVFGFLLHKGGVTSYDVIIGQLLLKDFTVLKVMLSASITGMLGIYLMRSVGFVRLHPKPGSWGATGVGSLIFGVGFALLGYCPGTGMGAAGQGSIDALLGTLGGITLGAGLFAVAYPRLKRGILSRGDFGSLTIPELLRVQPWLVVIPTAGLLTAFLAVLERAGG